jgi:Zn-dependent peptidase ImmA (M78 family)
MKHIEQKAEALLAEMEIVRPPINVEKVAHHLGIEIVQEPFENDLCGVLIRKNNHAVIGVNKSHARVRQRFTMAHEVAHFHLRHVGEIFVDEHVLNKRDGRSSYAIDPQEIEANSFAAALLMPASMVERAVVDRITKNPSLSLSTLTTDLAEKFQVSQQAMGYRLINLGLAGPNGDI